MSGEDRKLCKACPLSRACEPGALAGSVPAVYVGQAHGPFFLPCHMDHDYADDPRSAELLQCAGAAVFRANVGVACLIPRELLRLPPDQKLAFATSGELLAHHGEVTVQEAQSFLSIFPPEVLLAAELLKTDVRHIHPRRRPETQ